MKMVELGEKEQIAAIERPKDRANRIVYPSISLPLKALNGQSLSVDDNVNIVAVGKITGIEHTKYSKRVTLELHKISIKPNKKSLEEVITDAFNKKGK